jgi:hypothetical protein
VKRDRSEEKGKDILRRRDVRARLVIIVTKRRRRRRRKIRTR